MKNIKQHLKNFTAFTLIILATSCNNEEKLAPGDHTVDVKLSPVETRTLVQPVNASGLLFTETEAVLSFKIGGIIGELYVDEGDAVKKGQLLAKLDLTEINAQVSQAQNGVEKSERDLARIKRLYTDSVATLESLQNTTTSLNVAQQDLRIAEFNQRFAEIRAVSNGKIIRKMKNKGELVSPGMPLFFMSDTGDDQWNLQAGISDKDWVKLKEGDKARVVFDAYPGIKFKGTVLRLAEGADPTNGSYKVEIQVDPNGKNFAVGMFAEATIYPEESTSYMMIPVAALIEGYGDQGFVFVLKDEDKVAKIPIKIAFLQDDMIVVQSGLENVKQVVSAGSGYLTEQSTVNVIKKGQKTNSRN